MLHMRGRTRRYVTLQLLNFVRIIRVIFKFIRGTGQLIFRILRFLYGQEGRERERETIKV
jgi:hypothetical protein